MIEVRTPAPVIQPTGWPLSRKQVWSVLPCAPTLVVAAGLVVLVAINLWWLSSIRIGFPLNVDESGYLTMALNETAALKSEGLLGLARVFLNQGWYAPLVPLLTVPVQLLFGEQILTGFLTIQVFFALLVFATYGIASRLINPAVGVLAALIVATSPGIEQYSRMYHFGVPSAALYTAAVYALLRSNNLTSRRWSIIWGILLGLIVLTRTVMLAFVPGLVLAAILLIAVNGDKRSRIIQLGIALGAGVLTAGTWYWKNLPLVLDYLFLFGYGQNSEFYGAQKSVASVDFWTTRLTSLVGQGLYLPLAALLLVAVVSGIVCILYLHTRSRTSNDGVSPARSDVLILLATFAEGYLVLTSSRNSGSGFILVLLPSAVLVALAALWAVPWRPWRAATATALIVVSAINIGMELPQFPKLAEARYVSVFDLARLPITDGRADIQRVVAESGYDPGPPASNMPPALRGWVYIDDAVASFLGDFAAAHGRKPVVWFASRDPFFNTNSVELATLINLHQPLSLGQLSSVQDGDRVEAYETALAGSGRFQPNFMISSDPGQAEFEPRITQAYAEGAARSLGFVLVNRLTLPDGREARIWWLDR